MIDVTPDEVPIIDSVAGVPGLVVATGLSGHGFGLGLGAGEMAARLATGGTPHVARDPFRMDRFATRHREGGLSMTADVIIIGAGITGLATAHALACDGVSVRLVEAYAPAAMGSGWTLAGVRQSGRHPAELDLARDAVARWATLADTLGAATGYRRSGNLRLARTEAEVPVIERLVADQAAAGLDITLLDAATLRVVAPSLAPHILCASFCASDGQAEPSTVAAAYHAALTRMGVRIDTGVRVRRIETAQGRFAALDTGAGRMPAGACLIAAGIGTPALLAPLGVDLPLRTPAGDGGADRAHCTLPRAGAGGGQCRHGRAPAG